MEWKLNKWTYIGIAAIAAYFIFKVAANAQSGGDDTPGDSPNTGAAPPQPIAPVVTGPDCVGSTDAMGHWRGVDTSGNCTPFALGGAGGDF